MSRFVEISSVTMTHFICVYNRRPLFRTRKGPEILFELANVRINRRSKKKQKFG